MLSLKHVCFFLALSCFFLVDKATASHVAGAEITYKYIDSSKYLIKVVYYRDCRGAAIYNPTTNFRCANATSKAYAINLILSTIEKIENLCDSNCYPNNTYGKGEGIEKHTYYATVNFADSVYANLLKCSSMILIETGQCCRNSAITTGASGENFYLSALLDLGNNLNNSSPEFFLNPRFFTGNFNPYYGIISANDTIDNDSLSFEFVNPKKDLKSHGLYLPNAPLAIPKV